MSWTSRLGNLGRFSPFTRPPNQAGSTKVSDSDFSYITAEDLRKHQADSITRQDHRSTSPVDYGPHRDTDMLVLKNKRKEYACHFPAYSIAKGELTIGNVRDGAAKKTNTPEPQRIKLLYKGKNLKDDRRTCKQEGLRDGSEILCTIAEPEASGSESSDGEDGSILSGSTELNGDASTKKRRNRGKRTKRRNRREGAGTPDQSAPNNLNIPSASAANTSRSASPAPAPTPATPLDKLNALQAKLTSFRPETDSFITSPPQDPGKRDFEHKRLSETILAQVLLKLDAVETEGDEDARFRRRELVKETQRVLNDIDGVVKQ